MNMRRISLAASCFIAFICASLAVGSSFGGSRREERLNNNLHDAAPAGLGKDMEQKWRNCWLDVISVREKDLEKTTTILSSQMKETLLECLRKNNVPISIYEEAKDYDNTWYIKYLLSQISWPRNPKQHLGPKKPTSDRALADIDDNDDETTTKRKHPSSPKHPPKKQKSDGKSSSRKKSSKSKKSKSKKSRSKKSHNNKPSAVSIGATAVGTCVFAALLFYCCHRCKKRNYSKYEQKDEKPLLTLSLSDFSLDSSQKSGSNSKKFGSLSFGRSGDNGKHASYHSNLESGLQHSSMTEASSLAFGNFNNAATPPLKPPPGRIVPAPPGPPLPPPPPVPSGDKPGPSPPPPPPLKGAPTPPRAPQPLTIKSKLPKPPAAPKHPGHSLSGGGDDGKVDDDAPKTKLKPFFWDKVMANPDQKMVWHEISSGSFQFNEEMIENLFGYSAGDKNKPENKKDSTSKDSPIQFIQIIDPKKAQNLSILLRALNVTIEEVCDALQVGSELPSELLQTLLKMAPTVDEELKLRLFSGDISQLGPAERFLKVLVDIPFAFKRMESLAFKNSLREEISSLKESLTTLEAASKELRSSRLFLKLLEAVLKTGNRMNSGTYRGGAQAFKLDTLLKLSDVKGTDGKTTLLHFVVQEIIRSEGVRAARALRESDSFSSVKSEDFLEDSSNEMGIDYRSLGLQVVSHLGTDLENVRRASVLDADGITSTVSRLGQALVKTRDFLNTEMKNEDEDNGFYCTMKNFVEKAEGEITWLLKEEERIFTLVKSTVDYFHGSAGKDEGLRLFVIVRDFLIMLDKVCKEVEKSTKMTARPSRNKELPTSQPANQHQPFNQDSTRDLRQRLFPAIKDRRTDDSSSDDDSLSP